MQSKIKKKKEYNKAYHEANKDKIKKQKKEYREANKEEVKQYREQKIICACGSIHRLGDKARHEKSQKHQLYIQQCNV